MLYSANFERDYNWYLKYKDEFTFSGGDEYKKKVIYCKNGRDAKYCFYKNDSEGKIVMTNEPKLLLDIYRCKASINFQIKQWAEGRADGTLPGIEFSNAIRDKAQEYCRLIGIEFGDYIITIEEEFGLLPWMVDAVERQKVKHYNLEAMQN